MDESCRNLGTVGFAGNHCGQFPVRCGIRRFYQSAGMAFSAFPLMISLLLSSKEIIRHPLRSLLKPLALADQWLEMFRKE